MKLRVALLTAMLLSLVLGVNNAAVKTTVMPVKTAVTARTATQVAANAADAITIPQMLSYQGKLLDASGNPVPDTTYSVVFRLYTVPSGGGSFWNETQTVRTKAGLFSVLLGSVAPIESLPQAGTCYLGMKVGSDPEMTPKLQIASAAYAFLAHKADTANFAAISGALDSTRIAADAWNAYKLEGNDTSALDARYVNEGQNAGGDLTGTYPSPAIGAGKVDSTRLAAGMVTMSKLNRASAATGQVIKWTGSAWAPRNDSMGNDNDWARVGGDSVLYTIRQLGIARGGAGNMLWGSEQYSQVNLGVACTTGTSNSTESLMTVSGGYHNRACSSFATVAGGWMNTACKAWSTVGGGLMNVASGYVATVGGGENDSADSHGTVGGGQNNVSSYYATVGGGQGNHATNQNATVGGGAGNVASGGYATVGGGGSNTADSLEATVGGGAGNVASGGNATVGGGGDNTASKVYATAGGGYGNLASGMYATVGGGNGNLASGQGAAVAGGEYDTVAGSDGFAVGYRSVVPSAYASSAAFNGTRASASSQLSCGVLSKTGGSFTIDDPIDPQNKLLNHYFVESPDMSNLYSGSVVLDANGRGEVRLPDYFDALNRNPRVQLTGVGSSDIYVAEDISGNRFAVGGKPGTKVYWQVTGDRKDQSAEVIRTMMPVEQPKTGALAGVSWDDNFLTGCMQQLEAMGKAGEFTFRTAAGRQRYEDMLKRLHEAEQPRPQK